MRQCYNTSINNRQATEQSVLCLLSVLSARIPLFLFSEMKTHGGGCAIVRPGCRVFFFCPQIFFTDSCIFASNLVHFLFLLLTFSDRFATIIPIYRGTNACPSEGIELRRLKPDPLNLSVNTVVGSKGISDTESRYALISCEISAFFVSYVVPTFFLGGSACTKHRSKQQSRELSPRR